MLEVDANGNRCPLGLSGYVERMAGPVIVV